MNDNKFWNDDWMQLQQQYWQKLSEMGQQAVHQKPQSNPWDAGNWENAMTQWWKTVSPAMPDNNKNFVEKIINQGKQFFQFNSEIASNLEKTKDWSDALNMAFENLQTTFTGQAEKMSGAAEEGFSKMMGFWEGPAENWKKFAGDFGANMDIAGMPNLLEKMLDAPGLGYTREDEERYKQVMQSWLGYQTALAKYNHFFADMGNKSVTCMKDKVKDNISNEISIESGRALYDMWVSSCEEVYSEHTMTPEYAKVHGDLVNALMLFKKNYEEIVDMRLGSMNMPTRREMKTLQTRLQESRRELRSMRSDMMQLMDEMAELKQQVLKAETPAQSDFIKEETAKPAATVKKKAVTRKKATRKKAAAKPKTES